MHFTLSKTCPSIFAITCICITYLMVSLKVELIAQVSRMKNLLSSTGLVSVVLFVLLCALCEAYKYKVTPPDAWCEKATRLSKYQNSTSSKVGPCLLAKKGYRRSIDKSNSMKTEKIYISIKKTSTRIILICVRFLKRQFQ